jgi:mono/diheme cytochrome c family protein
MCHCLQFKYFKVLALLSAAAVVQLAKADDIPRSAEEVYRVVCHYCHDTGIGPEIKGRQLPAAYVSYLVRNGQGAMPAFRPTEISDTELERVAATIERGKGGGQ